MTREIFLSLSKNLDENDEKMKTMGVVKGGISSFLHFQ